MDEIFLDYILKWRLLLYKVKFRIRKVLIDMFLIEFFT